MTIPDIRTLTTTQLVLFFVAAGFCLFILKIVLTPGGRRGNWGRNKATLAAPWIIVPLILIVGGGIIWVITNIMGSMGTYFQT